MNNRNDKKLQHGDWRTLNCLELVVRVYPDLSKLHPDVAVLKITVKMDITRV